MDVSIDTALILMNLYLIDNIYTNNFTDDIFGGNLLMEIADHLAQFISVEKDTGNKAQAQNFLDDLSIQKWENDLQDMNEIYDDFTW